MLALFQGVLNRLKRLGLLLDERHLRGHRWLIGGGRSFTCGTRLLGQQLSYHVPLELRVSTDCRMPLFLLLQQFSVVLRFRVGPN